MYKDTVDYISDILTDYESKPKRMFWLAEKVFLVNSLVSVVLVFGLAWAGLWISAGAVVVLWMLTLTIFQEWKNS